MKNPINLIIYGVTTVWPKWQIIIPKECRQDLDFEIWKEYQLVIIQDQAFWLWKSWIVLSKYEKKFNKVREFWTISIGSKYHFVIPNEIRKLLWINVWDSLVVIWKSNEWVGFIQNNKIDLVFDFIRRNLPQLK